MILEKKKGKAKEKEKNRVVNPNKATSGELGKEKKKNSSKNENISLTNYKFA